MTFGSLFSGIGGIDIGLERAGFDPLWQCEINKFCRGLLTKRWPDIQLYGDIEDIDEKTPRPDILCGGFPCQDISTANTKGRGLDGAKSGLWFEFYRVIRILRPRYVLVENVANLVNKGLDRILQGLAEIGYDAEWQVLSAAQFGAWHLRRRIFIVAYTNSLDRQGSGETEFELEWTDYGVQREWNQSPDSSQRRRSTINVADPSELQRNGRCNNNCFSAQSKEISEFGDCSGENAATDPTSQQHRRENYTRRCKVARAHTSGEWGEENASSPGDCCEKTSAHTNSVFAGGTSQPLRPREGGWGSGFGGNRQYVRNPSKAMVDSDGRRYKKHRRSFSVFPEQFASERYRWWKAEPGICRVYDGIPNRVDRLRSLGNAVVPQVAEYVGRLILDHHRRGCERSGYGHYSHELVEEK
ncbi:MAG: DNA (cytosine-5-)-methyltransferase [Pseudomonadota bacterium]